MNGQTDWLDLFAASTGRLARGAFLLAGAPVLLAAIAYELVVHDTLKLVTCWFAYPAFLFLAANLLAKRLHDRGRSGWWTALVVVAIVMVWPWPYRFFDFVGVAALVWAFIELCLMPGEQGANRYGPSPLRAPGSA